MTGLRGVFTPQYGFGIVDAAAAASAPGAAVVAAPAPAKKGKSGR